MQKNEFIATGVLVLAVLLAPPAKSSVRPWSVPGQWRQTAQTESRTPSGPAHWTIEGGAPKIESRLSRDVGDRPATHRVLFTWTELPATLSPGEAVDVGVVALVLDNQALPAGARVRMDCWTSISSATDSRLPGNSRRVADAAVSPEEPEGTVERSQTTWRAPLSPDGDPMATGALHVRVTVEHGSNIVCYTRSYVWEPMTAAD